MNVEQRDTQEIETANIEISGRDWQLRTTVSVPKGPTAAQELLPLAHILADKVADYTSKSVEDSGQRISCKKGCGACCRQLVPVPEVEARHIRDLVDVMPEPRRSEIRRRFAEARRRLAESGLLEKLLTREHWREDEVQSVGMQYFLQNIPCPFLEDESCSIHPDRPVSCREYLVTSPAENCARPSSENIAQVELPFKIWPALARLEKPSPSSRFVRWVPLILAPEWADAHPAEPPTRSGTDLLRELFEQLSASNAKPKEQAQAPFESAPHQKSSRDTESLPRSEDPRNSQIHLAAGSAISSAAGESLQQQELPLRLGGVEDFARVEAMLRTACVNEATICRMFDIQEMSDIGSIDRSKADLSDLRGLMLRLFFFLDSVPSEEVERWLEPKLLGCLLKLDLLRRGGFGPAKDDRREVYYSPVWLYPVAGFLIASDRRTNPDGFLLSPMPDIVFPGIYDGTLHFLTAISQRSAEGALELCTGCGIGALVLSRTVKKVVASDLASRACHFASFNALLNRCSNVKIANGDLYDPVAGHEFDLIVAHPPYVPSVAQAMIYRDSGESGENLIRRVIAGLPEHLRPGGSFVSVCGGWDSYEGAFEERALSWIGSRENDFRLFFSRERELSVEEAAMQLPKLNDSQGDIGAEDWLKIFQGAGLKKRVYGTLIIERG